MDNAMESAGLLLSSQGPCGLPAVRAARFRPAASQLGVTVASALPLLPDDHPQASPDPPVELAQHRGGLAEAEVATPSDQIAGELLDDLLGAFAARAPCPCLEAVDGLRRDPAPRSLSTHKAEAQELADTRSGHRALGLVDPELETLWPDAISSCARATS